MKAICVDNRNSTILQKGEQYYLFEYNSTHVYASRFPSNESHCGCFQKSRFQVIGQTVPILEDNKVYKARLHNNKVYNVPLGIYYITQTKYGKTPSKTHCYFFKDLELKKPQGCFPLEWFMDFEEIDVTEERDPEVAELPKEKWEQIDIFQLLEPSN